MSTKNFKWAVATLILFVSITAYLPATPYHTPGYETKTQKVLEFIAEREVIPISQLVVVNQFHRDYQFLEKSYWVVTALDTIGNGWYTAMIAMDDNGCTDDIEKIEQADQMTRLAKFGKLEPALYEQLQLMSPEDQVQVAIWAVGSPKRSQDEIYMSLAAIYPEAKQSFQLSGKPFDVPNPKLVSQLEAEYLALLANDIRVQVRPLVDAIQAQGYSITAFDALPVIAVTLPKSVILEIVKRDDIGMIYLVGRMQETELDTAVPTDLVPFVWELGYRGSGVNIAILEAGKVDFTGTGIGGDNYLHQGQIRSCPIGEVEHKTFVASITASYHDILTGVAPEATIVDACTNGSDVDTVSALSWATSNSAVMNASISFSDNGEMQFIDKAFDYYARIGNDTVVVAGGNYDTETTYVSSPGLGWNVITVGAFDNLENTDWSDDVMWNDSKWKNPPGTDREKPEVVAPGVSINALGLDSELLWGTGTSRLSTLNLWV